MWKYLNGLLCLQFKRRKWVLDYGKIEWYCGIKKISFTDIVLYWSRTLTFLFFIYLFILLQW